MGSEFRERDTSSDAESLIFELGRMEITSVRLQSRDNSPSGYWLSCVSRPDAFTLNGFLSSGLQIKC